MSIEIPGWWLHSAVEVAPRLLGATLRHRSTEGDVVVRITEVEAYQGATDPGSHAFRGRTERNQAMFGPPGHLYMYFTYGMHWCANIVCGPVDQASGVLLRAGEVVEGRAVAWRRRYPELSLDKSSPARLRDLARGPARLAMALGLNRTHYGVGVLGTGAVQLRISQGRVPSSAGPRVGVAGEGGDANRFPWRWWITGDPTVSVYRAAASKRKARPL